MRLLNALRTDRHVTDSSRLHKYDGVGLFEPQIRVVDRHQHLALSAACNVLHAEQAHVVLVDSHRAEVESRLGHVQGARTTATRQQQTQRHFARKIRSCFRSLSISFVFDLVDFPGYGA